MKHLLLDANNLLFRARHACARRRYENVIVHTFFRSLKPIIEKFDPDYVYFVLDGYPKKRMEMQPEYKGTRKYHDKDGFRAQRKECIRIIKENVPFVTIRHPEAEADDVIGTLAKKAEKAGFITYMMTPDKDFAQLVSEKILLYRPGNKWKPTEVWGVKEVLDKFEITQVKQVIDFLGMMGDAVDNIPGLPGVGEKTAKKFLAEYGSMENLLANTNRLKGKIKEKIEANKKQGVLSKKLATIILNVPIKLDEEELQVQKFDAKKVQNIFEELEFRTLAKRLLSIEPKSNTNKVTQTASTNTNSGQMDLFAIREEIPITSVS